MGRVRIGTMLGVVVAVGLGAVGGFAASRTWPLLLLKSPQALAATEQVGGAGQPRDDWQRGDMNCDGAVDFGDINPFVLALSDQAGYEAAFPDCARQNADCNYDGQVEFGDINPFVALLVFGPPHIGECWYGPCEQRHDGRIWCPPDEFDLWVEYGVLHALHHDAEYNCCADDIVVSLTVTGQLVRLDETEVPHDPPCPCLCCYEVGATVVGLQPGTYTVEYCWVDCDLGPQCHVEEIVIP